MRRRRDEEDFRRIADIVSDNVQEWVGISTFLILTQALQHADSTRTALSHIQAGITSISTKLTEMESHIMATLEEDAAAVEALKGQVAQLGTDIQTLIDAFNASQAGTLTTEQQAQVDAIAASTADTSAAVAAEDSAVTSAVTPPPVP